MAKPKPRGAALLRQFFNRGEMTQADLARAINIYPQQLSHILAGRRVPTLQQAAGIESLTHIPATVWVST